MLKTKISLGVCMIILLTTNIFAFFLFASEGKSNDSSDLMDDESIVGIGLTKNDCNYTIARLNGYRYTQPLVFAEPSCETVKMGEVKRAIEEKINILKGSGQIRNASVYVRLFNRGEWISVEDDEKYSPGSLLKVPELITIMKMKEKDPDVLNTRLYFDKPIEINKTATFITKGIEPGKYYTVKELLNYMIAHSDNNATYLLNQFMDIPTFKKVFTDLGLSEPDMTSSDYKITAKEFSVFMKVLYNASYLSIRDSEFCTELLSKCDFSKGLMAGLPEHCNAAHKFGEGGDAKTRTFNLSESGIVYCKDKTYLITIMTNGPDMKALAPVISSISRLVHDKLDNYFQENG